MPAPRAAGTGVPRALMLATGAIAACVLIVAGVLVVVRGGGSSPSCDPDASGWNGAGGGPAETGRASAGVAHEPGPGWHPSWRFPEPGGSGPRVAAPPSAAGGSVYTATADGTLVALDAATGVEQWTSSPDAAERGVVPTPVALDGCAAVLATSFDVNGDNAGALRAVDLRGHQRRWGVRVDDHVFSAPQLVDGVAYAGLSFAVTAGSLDRDHFLDGYYASDGSRGFRKRFNAAIVASPTSDRQRLWVGDLDQNLYALGPGGRQLWAYTTDGIITVPAIFDGNDVIVASADRTVASLDPAGGREHWSVPVGDVRAAMAMGSGGEIIVATFDGTVHALSARDGSERWHRAIGASVTHAPVTAGDRVFAVDDSGVLHVLDAATGDERASWRAPAAAVGAPAIAGGHLYLTCADGTLYALPL